MNNNEYKEIIIYINSTEYQPFQNITPPNTPENLEEIYIKKENTSLLSKKKKKFIVLNKIKSLIK